MSFNLKACFCFYDIPRAQGICFLIIGLVGQLCRIDVFKALALYTSLLLLCCNVFCLEWTKDIFAIYLVPQIVHVSRTEPFLLMFHLGNSWIRYLRSAQDFSVLVFFASFLSVWRPWVFLWSGRCVCSEPWGKGWLSFYGGKDLSTCGRWKVFRGMYFLRGRFASAISV